MTAESLEHMVAFQRRGSNWRFFRVIQAQLHLADFNPLRAGTWILLPASLRNKKALINMENTDEFCFRRAVTRALNPVKKHAGRISRQLIWESREFNWEGLSFPVELKEISKVEKNNPGVSVNVFCFEKNVYPLRISKVSGKEVDLLLIEKEGKKHFCVIKNLSRLLSSQLDNHQHEEFICRRCLNHFSSQEELLKHSELCSSKDFVKLEMKEGVVKFKNFKRKETVPFVIYADFECLNTPWNDFK